MGRNLGLSYCWATSCWAGACEWRGVASWGQVSGLTDTCSRVSSDSWVILWWSVDLMTTVAMGQCVQLLMQLSTLIGLFSCLLLLPSRY